jgi:hypothetical protein
VAGRIVAVEAFWTWAVVGGIAVNMAAAVLFVILLLAAHRLPRRPRLFASLQHRRHGGRLAGRRALSGSRHLAALARFATVAGMALLSIA